MRGVYRDLFDRVAANAPAPATAVVARLPARRAQVAEAQRRPFNIGDYSIGRGVSGKVAEAGATHFDIRAKVYLKIPDSELGRVADYVISNFVRTSPVFICEIVGKKHRFFLDVDSKDQRDFNFQTFFPRFQKELLPILNKYRVNLAGPSREEKDIYERWGVRPAIFSSGTAVVLKSISEVNAGYHVIYPFITVTRRTYERVGTELKEKFSDLGSILDLAAWQLRGPFSDKVSADGRVENRPYRYHGTYDATGEKLPDARRDDPRSLFPELEEEAPVPFYKAVFCAASLRWTDYVTALDHSPSRQVAPAADPDVEISATEWRKIGVYYSPKVLDNKIQTALARGADESEIADIVVDYVNECLGMLHASSPQIYLVKAKNLDRDGTLPHLKWNSESSIKALLSAPKVQFGKKRRTPYQIWMDSVEKRIISGCVFLPGRVLPSDCINLFTGLRFSPAECDRYPWDEYRAPNGASFNLFLDVMKMFIVSGEKYGPNKRGCEEWLFDWEAYTLQKLVQSRSVPILMGDSGAGKTNALHYFGLLFGEHFLETSGDKILGKFNGELQDKIFVQINELNGLTDKSMRSSFLALVTDHDIEVEQKFVARHKVQNDSLNFAITSNNRSSDILLEVTPTERRFFFVRAKLPEGEDPIAEAHTIGASIAHFFEENEFGGLKAYMNFLLHRDIRDFDPAIVPTTKYLHMQIVQSMPAVHRFLLDAALQGYIASKDYIDKPSLENFNAVFPLSSTQETVFLQEDLLAHFRDWAHAGGHPRNRIGAVEFGHSLANLPGAARVEASEQNSMFKVYIAPLERLRAAISVKYRNLDLPALVSRD